jgi:hypothetical protein
MGAVQPLVTIPSEAFTSARDFLLALQPEVSRKPSVTELIFRGQGDAAWPLRPSALRTVHEPHRSPLVYEYALLHRFVEGCDAGGLALPEDTQQMRASLELGGLADRFRFTGWPPESLWPLCALAQHHGIPTRLLDWTRSHIVAAFFAARQALYPAQRLPSGYHASSDLVVWRCDLAQKHLFQDRIKVSTRLPSPSRNLSAQSGLFTVHGPFPPWKDRGHDPEVVLREEMDLNSIVDSRIQLGSPLKAFRLPKTEAVDLMRHCAVFGVSAATLFPGYEGAAQHAMDRLHVDSSSAND